MDHGNMDHGHMDHGHMGGSQPQCSMNVCIALAQEGGELINKVLDAVYLGLQQFMRCLSPMAHLWAPLTPAFPSCDHTSDRRLRMRPGHLETVRCCVRRQDECIRY